MADGKKHLKPIDGGKKDKPEPPTEEPMPAA